MIDQKYLEDVECVKYWVAMLTDGGRCTGGIKCRIDMAKAAFNNKKNLFNSILRGERSDKKTRKKT
jgi:hypothetical protein